MPTPASSPVPEHMHTVTTQLWFNGNCQEAIAVYEKAFGAKPVFPPMLSEDGKQVMHALLQFGDSQVMMADAYPGGTEKGPQGSSTAGIYLYVEDCDVMWSEALAAGCEAVMPLMDSFWGDRFGKVRDPFGHCWAIATQKLIMTPEEIHTGQQEWLAAKK